MNFDKWYGTQGHPNFNGYDASEEAWNACKDEIISIMEERSEKCCGTKAVELDRMVAVIRTVV